MRTSKAHVPKLGSARRMAAQRAPVVWMFAAAAAATGCHLFGDSSSGFAETHDLIEKIGKVRPAAYAADDGVLGGLKLDEFQYERLDSKSGKQGGADTFTAASACGVRYTLPDRAWGIVPDLGYDCDDQEAKKKVIESAATTLRNRLSVPLDQTAARLDALGWPALVMEQNGGEVVRSKVLDSGFKLESCIEPLAERLSRTQAEIMGARCEIFMNPGPRIKELRVTLGEARTRARKLLAVPTARKVRPVVERAAACAAQPGRAAFDAPGSTTGVAKGQPVAYELEASSDEEFQIEVSTMQFDAVLEVKDASCAQTRARSDRGGVGQTERLEWKVGSPGTYVVVVSAPGGSPVGPYELKFSAANTKTTPETRAAAEKFSAWFDKAANSDLEDAWRGAAEGELQLACLNRTRLTNQEVRQSGSTSTALRLCESGLRAANEARLQALRGDLPRRAEGRSESSPGSK